MVCRMSLVHCTCSIPRVERGHQLVDDLDGGEVEDLVIERRVVAGVGAEAEDFAAAEVIFACPLLGEDDLRRLHVDDGDLDFAVGDLMLGPAEDRAGAADFLAAEFGDGASKDVLPAGDVLSRDGVMDSRDSSSMLTRSMRTKWLVCER